MNNNEFDLGGEKAAFSISVKGSRIEPLNAFAQKLGDILTD